MDGDRVIGVSVIRVMQIGVVVTVRAKGD